MHHALVALGFRELPRNPDGAVGGEAMMDTLKAALRAPALGNKGLINFLNRARDADAASGGTAAR
jgi:hypothetical protein